MLYMYRIFSNYCIYSHFSYLLDILVNNLQSQITISSFFSSLESWVLLLYFNHFIWPTTTQVALVLELSSRAHLFNTKSYVLGKIQLSTYIFQDLYLRYSLGWTFKVFDIINIIPSLLQRIVVSFWGNGAFSLLYFLLNLQHTLTENIFKIIWEL